ncbi:MAG: hypothetical protein KBT11_09520 [Treponema sp.]|nr:hypothetical protein [Candidatus Treponema equifaecale]
MRILFSICFIISISSCLLPAQTESDSLYKLPETVAETSEGPKSGFMLAGSESGLYKITSNRTAIPLWTSGKVNKILRADDLSSGSKKTHWYFLTNQGIVHSSDLNIFSLRNEGLPFLTIKKYNGTDTVFVKQPAQLKDLAVHPEDSNILVTATKDNVYISYDGAMNWESLGSSSVTAGAKAVAVCNVYNPDGTANLVVFMSHPIYGFSYCIPQKSKKWTDCHGGFEIMPTQSYPDEISDIATVLKIDEQGNKSTEIYVSQTYRPKLYKFNWEAKRAEIIYSGTEPLDTIDGLYWDGTKIIYARPGEVASFNPSTLASDYPPPEYNKWRSYFNVLAKNDYINSVWIPNSTDENHPGLCLNELWLLYPDDINNKYAQKADNHKSIYVQSHHLVTQKGIDKYLGIIKANDLDSMVIDMKDDFGILRFEPTDPIVKEKGFVSPNWKIDLNTFVPQMKKEGIYLIARIVTFKDKHLAGYDKKQYAVWDKALKKPWKGIQGYEKVKDEAGNETGATKTLYYDEDWVDPYSPEVWEYFVHIAQDLVKQGFDEIQFDYIRFPTDGRNMANAQFRWRSEGMDKESALTSFLSYARENIDAPIGIDIYGANGWHRSGTRTGQDVEMFAEYVDVVCPMFYPSHFGNSDFNYEPVSERPYRIYYYGTYRNTVIGRNKLVIRPWVQAFYLNVPYDRKWYNKNYVTQQVYGVRDSVNRGYMYWNGVCRYDDISPDVGNSKYTGPSFEADPKFRKPALSGGSKAGEYPEQDEKVNNGPVENPNVDYSAWDSIREQENRDKSSFPKLSDLKKLWQAYGDS